MSIAQFNQLSEEEKTLVYNAPAMVAYLIGGADDNFDTQEEKRSKHVIRFRQAVGDPLLFDYFKEVEDKFDAQLVELIHQFGNLHAEVRTKILVDELTKLNDILPKIDGLYARALLKSLKTLAQAVAEASGGVVGFLGVSYEESHLMGLEMITYAS